LGRTPLYNAAWHAHREVAELLIAKGADVHAKDNVGGTPLHLTVRGGNDSNQVRYKRFVEMLISKGADVHAKNDYGETPLFIAAWHNHRTVAKLLIAKGADLNSKTRQGETPLHIAANYGQYELVELLLTERADVNAKTWDNKTPLDRTNQYGKAKIYDLLRKHGGKRGVELVEDRLNSLEKTLSQLQRDGDEGGDLFLKSEILSLREIISQLQYLIIGDDGGGDPDEPTIEKLQGMFVIRGKVDSKYEVQYHTGDNDWLVREEITLTANRQLYIDSSSFDEKRFYRVKLVE
jgi:ankyrin repeat protein